MASVAERAETLFGERVLGVCCAGRAAPAGCAVSPTWTEACAARTATGTSPLARAVLDAVVLERMAAPGAGPAAAVLLGLFERSMDAAAVATSIWRAAGREVGGASGDEEALRGELCRAADDVADLAVSYLGLLIKWPDMLGLGAQEPVAAVVLVDALMRRAAAAPDGAQDAALAALLRALAARLVRRWAGDGFFADVVGGVLHAVVFGAQKVGCAAEAALLAALVYELVQHAPVVPVVIAHETWLGGGSLRTGREIETRTLLGALLVFSTISANITLVTRLLNDLFPEPRSMGGRQVLDAAVYAQGAMRQCRVPVTNICRTLVKHSPQAKEALLAWVAAVLNANMDRVKTQYVRERCSSDGMLVGLLDVLLSLTAPLASKPACPDAGIDMLYPFTPAGTQRLHLGSLTPISSQDSIRECVLQQVAAAAATSGASFASECFFMTMVCIELAYNQTVTQLRNASARLASLVGTCKQLQERVAAGAARGESMADERMQLERAEYNLKSLMQVRHGWQALVLDRTLLQKMEGLVALFARTANRMATADTTADTTAETTAETTADSAPLAVLLSYPECFLLSVASVLREGALTPDMLFRPAAAEDMLDLVLWAIDGPRDLRNPFLRGSCVQCVQQLIPSAKDRSTQAIANLSILENHMLRRPHFARALFRFYVDVEKTGASSQFYDKFNHRRVVQKIFKHFWTLLPFRALVGAFIVSRDPDDRAVFGRAVLYIINDTNYELDESLSKLTEIRSVERERSDGARWAQLREEHRVDELDRLASAERSVRVYMKYSYANLRFLRCLVHDTDAACRAVLMADATLVDSLTSMLDYFLAQLVGAGASELKVHNPAQYGFDPRLLLTLLVDIYCAFAAYPQFRAAIAHDSRSYTPELLDRTQASLARHFVLAYATTQTFAELAAGVAALHRAAQADASRLDGFPDEFADAIMCTLMRDPVRLPSGSIVDRATITRILMSDGADPFTRVKMTIADATPVPDLRARIDAWVAQRLATHAPSPSSLPPPPPPPPPPYPSHSAM